MRGFVAVRAWGALILVALSAQLLAQTVAPSPARIRQGLALIRVGCDTDTPNETTVTQGGAPGAGGIVLKRLPGVRSSGTVMLSKEESQGLVDALKQELSDKAATMSAKQIDCLKPYVDRISEAIAPSARHAPGRPSALPA